MKTKTTLTETKESFFDQVFDAHPKEYPALMTREQFSDELYDYLWVMNTQNDQGLAEPSRRTATAWHKEYLKQAAERAN